ncbi:MAG: hypothetical protein ACYSOT_08350 [Planctomycetota bacterium]
MSAYQAAPSPQKKAARGGEPSSIQNYGGTRQFAISTKMRRGSKPPEQLFLKILSHGFKSTYCD